MVAAACIDKVGSYSIKFYLTRDQHHHARPTLIASRPKPNLPSSPLPQSFAVYSNRILAACIAPMAIAALSWLIYAIRLALLVKGVNTVRVFPAPANQAQGDGGGNGNGGAVRGARTLTRVGHVAADDKAQVPLPNHQPFS